MFCRFYSLPGVQQTSTLGSTWFTLCATDIYLMKYKKDRSNAVALCSAPTKCPELSA